MSPPAISKSDTATNGIHVDLKLEAARSTVVPNKLNAKLAAAELSHSLSIKFISNLEIVHYAAAAGYDAILIDLEHGTVGIEHTATLCIGALQVG